MKTARRGQDGAISARVEDSDDDILRGRVRAGLWILLISFVPFGVLALTGDRAKLPALAMVRGAQLAIILTMFFMLGLARSRRTYIIVALVTVITIAATDAAKGIIDGETATIFILTTVLLMVAGALLPWGVWPQAVSVTAVLTAIGVNVAGVPGSHARFEPFIGMLVAAITSIYIAYEFERQRLDRRDTLARLQTSEARSRSIVDTALDGIITMDARGLIQGFNPAAEQAFGQARADVVGRPVLEALVPPRLREEYRERFAKYLAAGERVRGSRFEVTSLRADGSEFPGELAINRSDYGGTTLVTGYLRDLTERKLAEEARTSAALLRVGREMMASLDRSLIVDRLGVLTTEVLGCDWSVTFLWDAKADAYVRAAAYPHPVGPQSLITAAAMTPLAAHLRRHDVVRVSEGAMDDFVPPAVRCHGASAAICCGLWRDDGTLAGINVAGYSGRASAFGVEQETIARGIAQIASLALNNTRLVEELEHASRIKSEFLSTMSHELRTPLNAILGYVEMAADGRCEADAQRDCFDRIKGAGRQLLELVEGTLAIGEIQAGRSETRVEAIPLSVLWSAAHERCALLRRGSEVTLDWRPSAAGTIVMTDARKLVLVVRHLVDNALKFTERGSVRVELLVRDDAFEIEVEDSGVGIAVENQQLIFEMFRQVDGSESRRYDGTGLGLYIVRRFIQQLGGSVTVESTAGKGSLFRVSLPRESPVPAAQRVA